MARFSLATRIAGRATPARHTSSGLAQLLNQFAFNGIGYQHGVTQTLTGSTEPIPEDFGSMVEYAYKSNGVVFACMLVRQMLFSEARFAFRRYENSRPSALFSAANLAILEEPWPGGTTGDLLTKAIQDADLAGNFYGLREGNTIRRLRPDWTHIIIGSRTMADRPEWAYDAEVAGYLYYPGGYSQGVRPDVFSVSEVAHFAPIPDPAARFRGMSWLTPVVRDIAGDSATTNHKLKFFENGATPNMVVKLETPTPDAFKEWVETLKEMTEGVSNAYKTLYLGAGADATVVGADFKQLDFKMTQGAGETRIAAAAGVPPVIVGLSEGLQASTYSNYSQARRRLADGTMRPLWRNFAGSATRIVGPPAGAHLWYDDRDIPFLSDDAIDQATVHASEAATFNSLINSGFTPESCKEAIAAGGDWTKLEHTGLFSVMLQPPNTQGAPDDLVTD